MPLPLLSLVGFSVWTVLVLVLGVGGHRWSRILFEDARLSDFSGDVPHVSERYRRIVRAHANCVENLPVFASLVLTASVVSYGSNLFDALCVAVLVAGVAQTSIHCASGSERAIAFRFTFFAVQVCAFLAIAALVLWNA